eukprot:gene1035-1566_t
MHGVGALAAERIEHDPSQALAVSLLAQVQRAYTAARREEAEPNAGTECEELVCEETSQAVKGRDFPQGIYIWGPIGSGKSLLMDLFYQTSPTPKHRAHFHEFMSDIHQRLHKLELAQPKILSKSLEGLPVYRYTSEAEAPHPIEVLAAQMAEEAQLLCLDEMHVTDVADAMVLRRLFECLVESGVHVAFTSNQAPDDLYQRGLSRKYFLPFIDLVNSRCSVAYVDNGLDYRTRAKLKAPATASEAIEAPRRDPGTTDFVMPAFATAEVGAMFSGKEGSDRLRAEWARRIGGAPEELQHHQLELQVDFGRSLQVIGVRESEAGDGRAVAWLPFRQICMSQVDGSVLGTPDYLALAAACSTVFLDGVPSIEWKHRDAARRLVHLIDALYESNTRIFMSSAVAPQEIFAVLLAPRERSEHKDSSGPDLTPEERLMFARAISRLVERCAIDV